MENLPTPLSRVELYLAKACGMDVTVPEAPQSRLEQYLAIIAGDTTIEMPTPHSLTEQWLAYILGVEPSPLLEVVGAHYIDNQKVDTRYLAVAAGMPGAVSPARPQNRKEQYWAVLAEILPVHGVLKYATGTNIYLTDVVSGIEELQFVYGDTFQQTYSGKNKLGIPDGSGAAGGKFTWSTQDGLITINGGDGAGSGTSTILTSTSFNLSASTRRLTLVFVGGTWSSGTIGIRVVNSGGSQIAYQQWSDGTSGTNATKEYTDDMIPNAVGVQLYISARAVVNNFKFYVMWTEGATTPTSYEPYVGGTASPNPDYPQQIDVVTGEQTVEVHGKNLFDYSKATQGFYNSEGVYQPNNNSNYTSDFISTDGRNMVLAKCSTIVSFIGINEFDVNKNFIKRTQTSQYTSSSLQVTVDSNTRYVRVAINKDGTPMTQESLADVQASVYLPQDYTLDLSSIELCKIGTYQDYIYKSGDDWYVHKDIGKQTIGSESNWDVSISKTDYVYYQTSNHTFISTGLDDIPSAQATQLLANTGNILYNSNTLAGFTFSLSGYLRVNLPKADFADTTAVKNHFTSNPMDVYYALATPTDTQITDSTLIGQLNAIDSAVLPKPVAYLDISASGTNLPASIKISYYGEEE